MRLKRYLVARRVFRGALFVLAWLALVGACMPVQLSSPLPATGTPSAAAPAETAASVSIRKTPFDRLSDRFSDGSLARADTATPRGAPSPSRTPAPSATMPLVPASLPTVSMGDTTPVMAQTTAQRPAASPSLSTSGPATAGQSGQGLAQPAQTAVTRLAPGPAPTSSILATGSATHSPATPPAPGSAPTPAIEPTGSVTRSAGRAVAGAGQGNPAHPVTAGDRVGVGLPYGQMTDYDWAGALPGWYLSWGVRPMPLLPERMRFTREQSARTQFAQMVRVRSGTIWPALSVITATAAWNPGALWLIGNEPDVAVQDNDTPDEYAAAYKTLYDAIKRADPSAEVAIGGIGQPSPLRMVWLDRVRSVYRSLYSAEIPVDVWNIHAFILREERDSWGVGVPPGLEADKGRLFEIRDHTDMAIFKQQVVDFRRWMAERGLRDKPLIVTEYGVLMPESYGFGPETVARFMTDTFDFFLTARDPELGYPADDNRLVQSFCWYSAADRMFPTSNLFDVDTRAITPLGERFREYVEGLR